MSSHDDLMNLPLGGPVVEHIVRVTGPASARAIREACYSLSESGAQWVPIEVRVTPPMCADLRDEKFQARYYTPDDGVLGFTIKPCLPADSDSWELVWKPGR